VIVTPSIHKEGYPYEIIGTKDPVVLIVTQARELIQHINQICVRNGVEYLTKIGSGRLNTRLRQMIKRLKIDKSIEIQEGDRNNMLIAVADSILIRHSNRHSEEHLRKFFDDINEQLCKPESLDEREMDIIWQQACRFSEKIREEQKQADESKSDDDYGNGTEEDIHLPDDPALYGLDKDIYGIINFSPTILAVARSRTNQIVKAKVVRHQHTEHDGTVTTTYGDYHHITCIFGATVNITNSRTIPEQALSL